MDHLLSSYLSYRVTCIETVAASVSRILLLPETTSLSYEAGQYVFIRLADGNESPLSIACAPRADGMLEFHLFHPERNSSAQQLLQIARDEQIWLIRGPEGKCTWSHLNPKLPVFFLAQGTGFAPIKAMLEAAPARVDVAFYWYMSNEKDFYLLNTLPEIVVPRLFSGENPMLVSLLNTHLAIAQAQVYAVASARTVRHLFDVLHAAGLPRAHFHSDMLS